MSTLVAAVFIEPSVFDEPEPFAFQHQATWLLLLLFTSLSVFTVNPSEPKAVKPPLFVYSAAVESG